MSRDSLGPVTTLSSFIRRRRTELNHTQSFIAEKLGVKSAEYISLIESGVRRLDLDRIPRLAEVLGVSASALSRLALEEQYPLLAATLEKPKRGSKSERTPTEESVLYKLKELPHDVRQMVIDMVDTLHKQNTPATRIHIA